MFLHGLVNDASTSLSFRPQIAGSKGYMFKMELQSEAQQLCDKSFTVVRETAPNTPSLMSNPVIKLLSLSVVKVLLTAAFPPLIVFYAARPGQQVHGLVFSEHSDSEEPGAEDPQSC